MYLKQTCSLLSYLRSYMYGIWEFPRFNRKSTIFRCCGCRSQFWAKFKYGSRKRPKLSRFFTAVFFEKPIQLSKFFGKLIRLSRFLSGSWSDCRGFFLEADPIVDVFPESWSECRDFLVDVSFDKLIPLPRFFFEKPTLICNTVNGPLP